MRRWGLSVLTVALRFPAEDSEKHVTTISDASLLLLFVEMGLPSGDSVVKL